MNTEGRPQIRMLGSPSIVGVQVIGVVPAKAFQLIALLIRARSLRLSRAHVASTLWDGNNSGTLGSLRQLLVRVRRALPDLDLFIADETSIGLGEVSDWIDWCRVEKAMTAGDPTSAIDLIQSVQGELLEGTDSATEVFYEWLARERLAFSERLIGFASAMLIELTRYGRGARNDLDTIAKVILDLDPTREATYRALIEAYGRNGMFDDSRRLYKDLIVMLREEHNATPSPETNMVARRVFSWRGVGAVPPAVHERSLVQPRVAFFEPEWLGEGVRRSLVRIFLEDVANELCRHRRFVVLAPHSSMRIDHRSGLPVTNDLLRADYSVSGFCKPDSGGSVLALRMTDCHNREVVWSGEFNIAAHAMLKSFSLVTLRVATSLGAAIDRGRAMAGRRDCDPGAYLHYLDGLSNLSRLDLPHLRRARKSFVEALNVSPQFAPPRAKVAQTLYLEWLQRGGTDPELLVSAREQSELALSSDPNDAVGYWMKGTVALYQRDFDSCAENLAEAEVLAPHSADLLVNYADALSHLGDADEGWARYEKAIDLNPTPPDHYWWAGATIALNQQKYQMAIDICSRLGDDEPVLSILAASHALLGRVEKAREYGRRIMELFPDAIEKSKRVTPDLRNIDRERRLEGLRLAGVAG